MLQIRRKPWFVWGLLVGIAFSFQPAYAQYSANFQTNIISSVTNNWSGDYIVGSNAFADALLIQAAGVLSNANGYLGYEVGGSNDSALVSDLHSIWRNAGALYVGYSGFGSSLTISNHGAVISTNGFVGYNSNSTTNNVLVTGAGALWTGLANLYVGFSGSDNSLVINGSGTVHSAAGYIGNGTSASENSVVVTGSGSVWDKLNTLFVGNSGACNSLVISNGGQVVNAYNSFGPPVGPVYIGYNSSSSNNSVLVSGTNSVWKNTASILSIGLYGAGNSLVISNGGQVNNQTSSVGSQPSSSNNSVLVDGSVWQSSEELYVGYWGSSNSLAVRNGGQTASADSYIGYIGDSGYNCAFLCGTGSVWSTGNLFLGGGADNTFNSSGPDNSLIISNGGLMACQNSYLGYSMYSSGNSVLVNGGGSVWSNSSVLYIGYGGPSNSLVIQNGGALFTGSAWLGYNVDSTNNRVLITGAGSVWRSTNSVNMGFAGSDNILAISNGGQFFGTAITVGISSDNNIAVVTGTGSALTVVTQLVLGNGTSSDNSLLIANGGHVRDSTAWLGTESTNNVALVTGAGSVWSNTSQLVLGLVSMGNSLIISNGGRVVDGFFDCIGCNSGGNSNSVRVVDGGIWQGSLQDIGQHGSGNSLVIDGGQVFSQDLIIGAVSPTCDNRVELDNGVLIATNAAHNGTLEVRNGIFILNGGTLQVDVLVMTSPCGLFVRNGGTVIVGTYMLDPNLSALGDGIPNGWKQQYNFDPLDPTVANADADGDGMSNLQEYLAGTDPTNNASYLHITSIAPQGNSLLVTWTMGAGKTNALQATAGGGYGTNGFSDIFVVTNTVGTVTNYLDIGATTNGAARYYRVRLVP